MGKLIYYIHVSLDGYMSGPDNDLSHFLPSESEHQYANDFLEAADAMVMGRGMYEVMTYWDSFDPNDMSQSRVEREFAAIYQANPRYVLSRTLSSVDEKATLIRDDVANQVRRLKSEAPGYLTLGCGPELFALFLQEDLVDEIRIHVMPFILGGGKALFAHFDATQDLRLISTRAFETGSVLLTYSVVA
jgi:dihydrofolate reductase